MQKTAHDPMNFKKAIFPSDDYFGFPSLLKQKIPKIKKLIPFGAKRRNWDGACHFFIEDYRFEMVWRNPKKYTSYFKRFPVIFTPDYSCYSEMPIVVQMFQYFRGLWIGRFYQEEDITVVPSVGWTDENSYDFAFRGIPTHHTVAVSTVGNMKDPVRRMYFEMGLEEMVDVLKPKTILMYGSARYNETYDNIVHFPSTPDTMFTGEPKEKKDDD